MSLINPSCQRVRRGNPPAIEYGLNRRGHPRLRSSVVRPGPRIGKLTHDPLQHLFGCHSSRSQQGRISLRPRAGGWDLVSAVPGRHCRMDASSGAPLTDLRTCNEAMAWRIEHRGPKGRGK